MKTPTFDIPALLECYTPLVYWSDEDQLWIARLPDLMGEFSAIHGDTPDEALEALRDMATFYAESELEDCPDGSSMVPPRRERWKWKACFNPADKCRSETPAVDLADILKRYSPVVEWSEEDQLWLAAYPDLLDPCTHGAGRTEAEALAQLHEIAIYHIEDELSHCRNGSTITPPREANPQ